MDTDAPVGPLIRLASTPAADDQTSEIRPLPAPTPPPLSPKDNPSLDITRILGQPKRNVNITPIRQEKKFSIGERIAKRLTFTWVCVRHTLQIIKQNKLNYCLGFFSVFTLVFVIALIQSVVNQSPVIFLKVAEGRTGEIDMRISSGAWSGYSRLNYSLLSDTMAFKTALTYHTPRYDMTFNMYNGAHCRNMSGADLWSPAWKYNGTAVGDPCVNRATSATLNCVYRHCVQIDKGAAVRSSGRLFLADFTREQRMGYGRMWTLPKPAADEVYVYRSLAQDLKLSVGDTLLVHVYSTWYFDEIMVRAAGPSVSQMYNAWSSVHVPFRVAGIFSDRAGKFDSGTSNAVIAEYSTFMSHLARHIHPNATDTFKGNVSGSNLYEYAQEVDWNLPNPRVSYYQDATFSTIRAGVIRWSSEALYRTGFTEINVDTPVLNRLRSLNFFSLFLGLIMSIIVTVLAFLSITLVYSLLMINVETRTFEMGVMRMIGLQRNELVQLLMTQALLYAVPGFVFGIAFAQGLMVLAARLFGSMVGLTIPIWLVRDGVIAAFIMGIAVPVFAAVFPIRAALGMNLHDSLDVRRSKTQAVKVSIERSEDGNVSTAVVVVGVCLVVFGFLIYYFMPLALISFNLSLLLQMFFFLLLGMLVGLVMLALNLENIWEKAVAYFFLFWEATYVFNLVLKNLVAHRERNMRTTLMFSLSLGFIIFVVVAFQVATDTFSFSEQQDEGVFMKVYASGDDVDGIPYAIRNLAQYENYATNNSKIVSYSWITHNMRDALKATRSSVSIQNLGKLYSYTQYVYGVSPNLYDTMINSFWYPGNLPDFSPYSFAQQLYTPMGSARMVMGSLYQSELLLTLDNDFYLTQVVPTEPRKTYYYDRLRALAYFDGAPWFTLSFFPSNSAQDALVSLPSFVRLSHGEINSVRDIPMRIFALQLSASLSETELDTLYTELKRLANTEAGVNVYDYRDEVDSINTAGDLMNYFFVFATFTVMLICFFSLVSSMYTNIVEQTKEIAILRAIGMRVSWLTRIYVEEAFVIIFAASGMGMIIGIVVGWTMAVQRSLFTQLPIVFRFPWQIFLLVFGLSVLMALLSSFGPARRILKLSVIESLRISV